MKSILGKAAKATASSVVPGAGVAMALAPGKGKRKRKRVARLTLLDGSKIAIPADSVLYAMKSNQGGGCHLRIKWSKDSSEWLSVSEKMDKAVKALGWCYDG